MRGMALVATAGLLLGGCEQVCALAVKPVVPPVQACTKPARGIVQQCTARR